MKDIDWVFDGASVEAANCNPTMTGMARVHRSVAFALVCFFAVVL
jgi:hypothetical protein